MFFFNLHSLLLTATTDPATASSTGSGIVVAVEDLKQSRSFGEFGSKLYDKLADFYAKLPTIGSNLVWSAINILVILIISQLILNVITRITGHYIRKASKISTPEAKRQLSVLSLVRSAARYLIYAVAIILMLYAIGWGRIVTAALAGAGIGALAIGFGAQSLVKDVVSGLFMMFENQYAVGDYIELENISGVVEATALRVTYLRTLGGDQIIIPNGSITFVINHTNSNNTATVDIPTSYDNDTRMILNVIDQCLDHFATEYEELIKSPPLNLGVIEFADSSVKIRIICSSKLYKQGDVERAIRLCVKEAFEASGISFPYPHVIVSESKTTTTTTPPKSANTASKSPSLNKTSSSIQSPWSNKKMYEGDYDGES